MTTRRRWQGKYCDEIKLVARSYLKGAFLFDFITSIPVSIIEFAIYRQCKYLLRIASRSSPGQQKVQVLPMMITNRCTQVPGMRMVSMRRSRIGRLRSCVECTFSSTTSHLIPRSDIRARGQKTVACDQNGSSVSGRQNTGECQGPVCLCLL